MRAITNTTSYNIVSLVSVYQLITSYFQLPCILQLLRCQRRLTAHMQLATKEQPYLAALASTLYNLHAQYFNNICNVHVCIQLQVTMNNSIIAWVLKECFSQVIKYNYNYTIISSSQQLIRLVQLLIGFTNEITREMINTDKLYYMKTINSTAEGYFNNCRFPCANQCVLELQPLSAATDMSTARCGTKDIC